MNPFVYRNKIYEKKIKFNMNDLGQGGLLLAYMHVFLLFLCPLLFAGILF